MNPKNTQDKKSNENMKNKRGSKCHSAQLTSLTHTGDSQQALICDKQHVLICLCIGHGTVPSSYFPIPHLSKVEYTCYQSQRPMLWRIMLRRLSWPVLHDPACLWPQWDNFLFRRGWGTPTMHRLSRPNCQIPIPTATGPNHNSDNSGGHRCSLSWISEARIT